MVQIGNKFQVGSMFFVFVFFFFSKHSVNMQNAQGEDVELYVPRKCTYSSQLVRADDHAAIQLNIPLLDENGRLTGASTPIVICGTLRRDGLSDHAINDICQRKGFLKSVVPKKMMI